jgi:TPR repeat protein
MSTDIKQFLTENYQIKINCGYDCISDKIEKLFINNIIDHTIECGNYYYIVGLYCYHIHKNCDEMIKYYLMAIEKGNSDAMYQLGYYYKNITNYDEMIKYYLMAIQKGNCDARYQLRDYYKNIENYDEIKKNYLMAIEKDNSDAMCKLGDYYKNIKNYDEMKKYYLMAIEKDNSYAMCQLGHYYKNISYVRKYGQYQIICYKSIFTNYNFMIKYYSMAISRGNSHAMYKLGNYHEKISHDYKEMKKYYLMAIANNDNCNAMFKMAVYYDYTKNNYHKMKKYYLMAIDKGCCKSMINLGLHYQYSEKNYDEMQKYYLMAIRKKNINAMFFLAKYFDIIGDYHQMLKYAEMALNLNVDSFELIFVSNYGIDTFRSFCINDNLTLAKSWYKLKLKKFDIRSNNDELFREALQPQIINWLSLLCDNYYFDGETKYIIENDEMYYHLMRMSKNRLSVFKEELYLKRYDPSIPSNHLFINYESFQD